MSPAVRIPTRFTSCVVLSLCITLFLICPSGCSSGDSTPPGSGTSPNSPTPQDVQQTGQPGQFNERVRAIISAPDTTGDIYVVGDFTTYNGLSVPPLVRIKPDGTLNENFKLQLNISLANSQSVVAIAPVDDGSGDVYVGEVFVNLAAQRARIWKLHADGSVDRSFIQGEINFTGDFPIEPTMIYRIVPIGDRSGRAYVCGRFDRYNGTPVSHMVLVTPKGTLDPTFVSAAVTPIFNIFPADDGTGDLYVTNFRLTGPSSGGPGTVYRLNADGSLDSGFTPLSAGVAGFDGSINAALPVGDGSGDIFVGGSTIYLGTGAPAPTINPDGFRGLVRVNSDGTFDLTSPTPAVPGGALHMIRAVDGTRDILISNGDQLMRFKADTSIDPGFVTGTVTGPRSIIFALLPLNDGTGDLYVGGDVMTYNGVSAGNAVRLNANGTLDGR